MHAKPSALITTPARAVISLFAPQGVQPRHAAYLQPDMHQDEALDPPYETSRKNKPGTCISLPEILSLVVDHDARRLIKSRQELWVSCPANCVGGPVPDYPPKLVTASWASLRRDTRAVAVVAMPRSVPVLSHHTVPEL